MPEFYFQSDKEVRSLLAAWPLCVITPLSINEYILKKIFYGLYCEPIFRINAQESIVDCSL